MDTEHPQAPISLLGCIRKPSLALVETVVEWGTLVVVVTLASYVATWRQDASQMTQEQQTAFRIWHTQLVDWGMRLTYLFAAVSLATHLLHSP